MRLKNWSRLSKIRPITIYAYDNDKLVGLVRGLSDKVSVHYIQDLLVHPDYQNQGIGSTLLEKAVNLYSESRKHVLLNVLLTDEEPSVVEFYESQGFQNTKKDTKRKINAFIKWGPETC